jgi:hypothetical protein
LTGTRRALPPNGWLVRPARLAIHVAPPLSFADMENNRDGWDQCAKLLENCVRGLSENVSGTE